MTHLFKNMSTETAYIDKKPMLGMSEAEREAYEAKYRAGLRDSKTVYVGNLGFSVQEESVHALFSSVGTVRDIVMGLDRTRKTPCGFCFVEFATHDGAEDAIRYLNGRKLDKRPLRIDWDLGNVRQENRYWGRGASGGQVRDEYRLNFDPERGGVGSRVSRILGGGVVEVDEREYGAWAYTRFNAHDRRTTTKRQREEALSDARYEYNPDNKDGRKRARVDEDGDDA